jgi:hypothetical protein
MQRAIKWGLVALLLAGLLGNALAAEEIKITRRIPFSGALDTAAPLRLMLHANAFSILPQQAVTGYYGSPPPAPPGTGVGAAALGNVLGILLVKGITERKEQARLEFIQQIEDALANFNIGQELSAEVATTLKRAQFSSLAIEPVDEPANLEQPGLLVRIQENLILTLSTQCSFDAQLRSVHMETAARLWSKGKTKPVYLSRLRFSSPSLGDLGMDDLRDSWSANNGALLLGYLRQGIRETAH